MKYWRLRSVTVGVGCLRYLDHFWDRIFLYRKDGDYTIDNSLAERCIRPLANERKNSLFFGSDKMARVSATYHSIVSTCKLQGYSILEYLKKFFEEIVAGNRDYGKLMPSTIGNYSADIIASPPWLFLFLGSPLNRLIFSKKDAILFGHVR